MKVIVAHPGQQHSYQAAIALKEKGMLYRYVTTVYDSPNSLMMRVGKRFMKRDNLKRAQGRKNELLDGNVTQFCELYGLMLLLILRLDKTKKRVFYNKFNQFVSRRFGRKVADYAIKHEVDAVICYDTSSAECFRILEKKAPKIIRILDNAAPNRYGLCMNTTGLMWRVTSLLNREIPSKTIFWMRRRRNPTGKRQNWPIITLLLHPSPRECL